MPHGIMGFLDRVRSAHSKEKSATPFGVRLSEVPPVGGELSLEWPDKSKVCDPGDSLSDSLGDVFDPWLARLIEVWPALGDDVKGEILTLAGLRP